MYKPSKLGKLLNAISYPRVLVLLRQIVRELKRGNDLTEARLRVECPDAALSMRQGKRTGKLVDVHATTVQELNERWRKEHPKAEDM